MNNTSVVKKFHKAHKATGPSFLLANYVPPISPLSLFELSGYLYVVTLLKGYSTNILKDAQNLPKAL